MKRILCIILVLGLVLGSQDTYGDQPARGVAGVVVTVKENPSKRFVTDARGAFALPGLAPGDYTLLFRAQKAADTKVQSTTAVVVAQSYSIKVDGTKKPTSRSAASDQLLAGLAVPVQVGSGAEIRGQVTAGQTQKMVWISPELGSHIAGHWVPADSPEAKGHGARQTMWMKGSDTQRMIENRDSMHQAGFGLGGGQ